MRVDGSDAGSPILEKVVKKLADSGTATSGTGSSKGTSTKEAAKAAENMYTSAKWMKCWSLLLGAMAASVVA